MLQPLAEMEFARKHRIRSSVSILLAVAYAALVVTVLLWTVMSILWYVAVGITAVFPAVVVCWVVTKLNNHKRVRELVEEKLDVVAAAHQASRTASRLADVLWKPANKSGC